MEKKIAKLILKAKKYLAEKSPSTESTFTMIFCGMHIISKLEDKSSIDGVTICRQCAKDHTRGGKL